VLALINQARSAAGLPALTLTQGLEASSSAHNLLMASGCGLSHQCPGEPPAGDRETAAGVDCRLNILSSTFTHIGIAVYRDSSGTV